MRVLSFRFLREFWQAPGNAAAETPLRNWYQIAKQADWQNFGDIRATYNSVDQETGSRRIIFDIGGNKYRLITVIDYERHKVFIRFVLTHKEYDIGNWKKDTFGADWDKPGTPTVQGTPPRKRPRRKRK
jgi:mRNA interferase HigB